jgi:hypothetical protein
MVPPKAFQATIAGHMRALKRQFGTSSLFCRLRQIELGIQDKLGLKSIYFGKFGSGPVPAEKNHHKIVSKH